MLINQAEARKILLEEAKRASQKEAPGEWEKAIESFSQACKGLPQTHVAFLGTALLAKATCRDVDVFLIKAKAGKKGFSARSLCHGVLTPLAPELGVSLGVTGREPLNNQPYFRITRLTADIPIKGNVRPVLDALLALLERVKRIESDAEARKALRAFIRVRREHNPRYGDSLEVDPGLTPERLLEAIRTFVAEDSEGGKRAQAVAAGLMDLFAGPSRVKTIRVNDPGRRMPGDVGVKMASNPSRWEKVLEVRDKPVSPADVRLFTEKAAEAGAQEAAILAVAQKQGPLRIEEHRGVAASMGVSLSLFLGWEPFVEQVLYWAHPPRHEAAKLAASLIQARLIEAEVSEHGVERWLTMVSATSS